MSGRDKQFIHGKCGTATKLYSCVQASQPISLQEAAFFVFLDVTADMWGDPLQKKKSIVTVAVFATVMNLSH